MTSSTNYYDIVKHYEKCFEEHGDSHLGVDWPNENDVNTRYEIMLDITKFGKAVAEPVTLLDFGCGTAALLSYIREQKIPNIIYSGLDMSKKYIDFAKKKFPDTTFYQQDILQNADLPMFDYIVMNGVFTEKREMEFDRMLEYFKQVISACFKCANKGLAFNVMTKHVDWEREDLFHLPFDTLAAFLKKEIGRNFIIRNDYGLYEYTTYLYK